MASASGDPLVTVPLACLYRVQTNAAHELSTAAYGDFVVFSTAEGLRAQIGDVAWPLGRHAATLRFDDHTYCFQLHDQPAFYYCLCLSPDTAGEATDLLQAVLASGTAYHDQERIALAQAPAPGGPDVRAEAGAGAPTRADHIASGLQRGGQLAAAGVLAAAGFLGAAMQRGADAAVARMAPAGEGARQVSPETQARLEQARSFAAKAAEVSGRAVHGALSVTAQVAGSLAQRISSTDFGRQLSRGHVAGASTQDIRKVGVAGVEAMEALYDSLADAARLVLAHSHAATTQVVGHKYGPSAAQATGAGLAVAQSAAQAGLNVYKLRPTALVRKMVKGTAKEVALGSAGASRSGSEASLPTAGGPGPGPAPSAASAPAAAGGMVLPAGGPAAAAAMLAAVTAPPPGVAPGPPVTAPLPSLVAGGGGPYPVVGPGPGPSVIPPPPTGPPAGPTQGQQPVQMTALPAGCVADGVEVVGPVPAHPVPRPGPPGAGPPLVVADYTPAAAALGGAGGPGAGGTGIGGSAGLPYPAVSEAQYGARYYPAVPGR